MIGILVFEIIIVLLTIAIWFYMDKQGHKNVGKKLLILFIAVLLFEVMSEPMWRNYSLGRWAYIYHDVSWIITLGWVNLFMVSMLLVDHFWKTLSEGKKFWLYLLVITIITTPIEVMLLKTGLRGYDPSLLSTMTGVMIPFTTAPIEIIGVIPIIAALIIPFYKVITQLLKIEV